MRADQSGSFLGWREIGLAGSHRKRRRSDPPSLTKHRTDADEKTLRTKAEETVKDEGYEAERRGCKYQAITAFSTG